MNDSESSIEMDQFAKSLEARFGAQLFDMGMPDPEIEEVQHSVRMLTHKYKMESYAEQKRRSEFLRECIIWGTDNSGESLVVDQTHVISQAVADELSELCELAEVLDRVRARTYKRQ